MSVMNILMEIAIRISECQCHNRKINVCPGKKLKLLSYLTVMSVLSVYPKQNEVKE